MQAYSHWLHLLDFSALCIFKCVLKWLSRENAKSHRLHLFHFCPLCILKSLLKLPASEDAKSYWLHLFDLSPLMATVGFQMGPQIACQRGYIITLVTFNSLNTVFFTVHCQLSP